MVFLPLRSSSSGEARVRAAWQTQVAVAGKTPGVLPQLVQRRQELLPRFASVYQQLCALPRRVHRRPGILRIGRSCRSHKVEEKNVQLSSSLTVQGEKRPMKPEAWSKRLWVFTLLGGLLGASCAARQGPGLSMKGAPAPSSTLRATAFSEQLPAVTTAAATRALAALPLAAQAQVTAVLGREQPAYQMVAQGEGLHADNPRHGLAVDFTREGIQVYSAGARWGMSFSGYGYGEAVGVGAAVAPQATANRVEYQRGVVTEWYVNGPLGLEQGFTLAQEPRQRRDGPLTVALTLSSDLQAFLEPGGDELSLRRADGSIALRYRGVSAQDATGRELRTWLAVEGDQVRLHVDDAGAAYPVVIDPWIQQAKLTASDGEADDEFGFSVAVSGDTVVVGARVGRAAYVFVQPTKGWADTSTFTAKLTIAGGEADDGFGISVAVSGDTVVVGAPFSDSGISNSKRGAAYVFVQPTAGWVDTSIPTARLLKAPASASDQFGISVAVSGDTVVVGANLGRVDSVTVGTASVFVQPTAGWVDTSTSARLSAGEGLRSGDFGRSVAMSGDTVVVGAPFADFSDDLNANQGAAYVFVKPTGGWTTTSTFTAKLTTADGAVDDQFGTSVAMSGDTVVVGSLNQIGSHANQGSAYVFVQPTGGWTTTSTFTAKLTAADGQANDLLGASVAMSGDTVVVGAYFNASHGAAYVFVRPTGGWTTTSTFTQKLGGTPLGAAFGRSVAMSEDTVVVGAPLSEIDSQFAQGAAYVFIIDADGDGVFPPQDCDDTNPAIHPGASEVCNGVDDDCDGFTDTSATGTPVACDDHDACTTTDTCSAPGQCAGGPPLNCEDNNLCTTDSCDTTRGCQHTAVTDGTACSDGNACNGAETCQAGSCTPGTAVTCTALDQCHVSGTCDPGTGACSNPPTPDDTQCDDGDPHTVNDSCQSGICAGLIPVCGDTAGSGGSDIPCACGDTVVTTTKLNPLLDPVASSGVGDTCPSDGLIVASGVTLDCGAAALRGSGSGTGLTLAAVSAVTVKNCNIENFDTGIDISSSTAVTLLNDKARFNTTGVAAAATSNLLLSNISLQKNLTDGALFTAVADTTVDGSRLEANGAAGVRCAGQCTFVTVAHNQVNDNGANGIAFANGGNHHNFILANTAKSNCPGCVSAGNGIVLAGDTTDTEVAGNEVMGNHRGLVLATDGGAPGHNTVSNNKAEKNLAEGLLIEGGNNQVSNNRGQRNGSDGLAVTGIGNTVGGNTFNLNAGHGLCTTPGNIDGGGNKGKDNGQLPNVNINGGC